MKISQNISFSKQLIIYLILVLFVVFFLISLALVNSLEQFINNNAYSQAKAIANNALIIFEREIARIESIPQNVTDMQGELNYKNIPDLPIRILRSYKTLIGSSVHYDLKNPEVADFIHINVTVQQMRKSISLNPILVATIVIRTQLKSSSRHPITDIGFIPK